MGLSSLSKYTKSHISPMTNLVIPVINLLTASLRPGLCGRGRLERAESAVQGKIRPKLWFLGWFLTLKVHVLHG